MVIWNREPLPIALDEESLSALIDRGWLVEDFSTTTGCEGPKLHKYIDPALLLLDKLDQEN